MAWELRTEHATIRVKNGNWEPGPRLAELLADGWEPFQISDIDTPTNHHIHGSPSCPMVWLRRQVHFTEEKCSHPEPSRWFDQSSMTGGCMQCGARWVE